VFSWFRRRPPKTAIDPVFGLLRFRIVTGKVDVRHWSGSITFLPGLSPVAVDMPDVDGAPDAARAAGELEELRRRCPGQPS
jgi:hypothetical protein